MSILAYIILAAVLFAIATVIMDRRARRKTDPVADAWDAIRSDRSTQPRQMITPGVFASDDEMVIDATTRYDTSDTE